MSRVVMYFCRMYHIMLSFAWNVSLWNKLHESGCETKLTNNIQLRIIFSLRPLLMNTESYLRGKVFPNIFLYFLTLVISWVSKLPGVRAVVTLFCFHQLANIATNAILPLWLLLPTDEYGFDWGTTEVGFFMASAAIVTVFTLFKKK